MTDETHIGIVESMWRYRWMSAAIVLGTVLLSIGAGILVAPKAEARATVALATPPANSVLAPGISGDASLARYTAQRAGFVTSDAVLTAVAEKLGIESVTTLRRDISASPSSTSNTMVITARADDGPKAVELAGATVAAYRAETQKDVTKLTDAAVGAIEENAQGVRDRVASASGAESAVAASSAATTLSELAVQASEISTSSALFGDGVEFVIAPRADAVTLPSIPLREAGLGLVLGLVLAATAAWIRADRN